MPTFEEQFRAVQPTAHLFARSILHHRSDAEDSVQNAAIKALSAYNQYDASRPFKAWFFKIVKNCCLDRLRLQQRDAHNLSTDLACDPNNGSAAVIAEEVARCMAKLSTPHQEILRLRYFADMTYADMADYLKIPNGTVMSRLHAARIAFAEQHGDYRD